VNVPGLGRPKVVSKPWGEEQVFAANAKYAGKVIRIKAGESLSYQYHERKEETVFVLEGTLGFETEAGGSRLLLELKAGELFHIVPGTRHRMYAPSGDCTIAEVSTPELDDVVRLEDRYGRQGTSAP
jgi:mannose-6-phosphate isomerase-like protein (cupin superfamily)